jgi:hypothetical protein
MFKDFVLTGAVVFIFAGCTIQAPKEVTSSCPMFHVSGQGRCAPRLPDPDVWKQIPDRSTRTE